MVSVASDGTRDLASVVAFGVAATSTAHLLYSLVGVASAAPSRGTASSLQQTPKPGNITTTVVLSHGSQDASVSVPIEQVLPGDVVSSRSPQAGATEFKRVLRLVRKTATELVTLALADAHTGKVVEQITGTPEHPFYVSGRGWVSMGALGIGTQLVTRAGPGLVVQSIERTNHPEGVAVYNLVVEDDHSYFVGNTDGGIWTHNENCISIAKAFKRKFGGDVYKLSPEARGFVDRADPPAFGPMDEYGDFEPWDSHYVHVKYGMVRDPMMLGHRNPVPFKEWQRHWNNWDYHNFELVPPEVLKRLR